VVVASQHSACFFALRDREPDTDVAAPARFASAASREGAWFPWNGSLGPATLRRRAALRAAAPNCCATRLRHFVSPSCYPGGRPRRQCRGVRVTRRDIQSPRGIQPILPPRRSGPARTPVCERSRGPADIESVGHEPRSLLPRRSSQCDSPLWGRSPGHGTASAATEDSTRIVYPGAGPQGTPQTASRAEPSKEGDRGDGTGLVRGGRHCGRI